MAYSIDFKDHFYLQLISFPTFTEPCFLQIYWDYDKVRFCKTQIIGAQSRELLVEKGFLLASKATELDILFSKPVVPFIQNLDTRYGRDGEAFELTMGGRFYHNTFRWWNAATPDEWEALDEMVAVVRKVDAKVDYDKVGTKAFEVLEENDGEQSLMIEMTDWL